MYVSKTLALLSITSMSFQCLDGHPDCPSTAGRETAIAGAFPWDAETSTLTQTDLVAWKGKNIKGIYMVMHSKIIKTN